MVVAPLPENERERLLALQFYNILDTPAEEDFNEIVMLASRICEAEISLISLIDESRQWFKAKVGLDANETHRDYAFCAHAIHQPEIMEVHDTHEDLRFVDNPLVTDDPNIRFYAGMPLETSDGYRLGTLCVIDSKPKKLTEEQRSALRILAKQAMKLMELRIKNQMLEQNLHMRERLMSMLVHDVKGPIGSLGMMAAMMSEDPGLTKDMVDMLGEMHLVATRTTHLIDHLSTWAAQIGHEHTANPQWIALEVFVQEVQELNAAALKHKNLRIETDLALTKVFTEPEMLRFILRNLVGNAIKFSENATITIRSRTDGAHHWLLEVADQGVGMQPEQLDKLFRWEMRYTHPGTQNEKGTGLGLLLVQEFVRKLRGQLHIQSAPGQGSTFSIQLPTL